MTTPSQGRADAARPDAEALAHEYGYAVEETGGGCTAFRRNFEDGSYVLITRVDDPSVPTDPTQPAVAGWYDAEGNLLDHERQCLDLESAFNVVFQRLPKYPNVVVQLIGTDGNAFAILGAVTKALKRAGISKEEREKFTQEATAGDYDNVLTTAMRWVVVE